MQTSNCYDESPENLAFLDIMLPPPLNPPLSPSPETPHSPLRRPHAHTWHRRVGCGMLLIGTLPKRTTKTTDLLAMYHRGKFCFKNVEASHWDPGKLTHFNGYLDPFIYGLTHKFNEFRAILVSIPVLICVNLQGSQCLVSTFLWQNFRVSIASLNTSTRSPVSFPRFFFV